MEKYESESHLPPLDVNIEVLQYISNSYGNQADIVSNLLKWLGIPPGYTTLRVNTYLCDSSSVLSTVRNELQQKYSGRRKLAPPEAYIHPLVHDAIIVDNRGPNNVQKVLKEVIVGLDCAMAVLRGADVFAQGIMGCPHDITVGDTVSVYGDLKGTCCRGFLKKFDGPKIFVGNGVMRMSRNDLFGPESLNVSGLAINILDPLYDAPSLNNFLSTQIFPQNLPSIICSHILGPLPGEKVLDMCAAPGGKTVHIATLMKNQGIVIAFDKNLKKVEKIKENACKWGITCVHPFIQDGTKSCDSKADTDGAPPYPPGTFDRILLDAPCSALGQRPSSCNRKPLKEIQSYPPLQAKLFTQAVLLLKEGGTLVYSTCTVFVEENEERVSWALKKFPELRHSEQTIHHGGWGLPVPDLTSQQLKLLQRFDPCSLDVTKSTSPENDTIGFFIAKFVKR